MQGVICGHIHHAANRNIGDVHYLNCGDWVESCTALVETEAGEFHILRWREEMEARNRTLLLARPSPRRRDLARALRTTSLGPKAEVERSGRPTRDRSRARRVSGRHDRPAPLLR